MTCQSGGARGKWAGHPHKLAGRMLYSIARELTAAWAMQFPLGGGTYPAVLDQTNRTYTGAVECSLVRCDAKVA